VCGGNGEPVALLAGGDGPAIVEASCSLFLLFPVVSSGPTEEALLLAGLRQVLWRSAGGREGGGTGAVNWQGGVMKVLKAKKPGGMPRAGH